MKPIEKQPEGTASPRYDPISHRLNSLIGCGDSGLLGVASPVTSRALPARTELLTYRQGIVGVSALRAGWAGHVEQLADGRRQIVHLVLPGEIITYPRPGRTLASSTVVALTPVDVCMWRISDDPALAATHDTALGASDALEQRCLMNQIARIGRRSAYERLGHLLLEISERLGLAGIRGDNGFPVPLTQETIADVLGLTSVHVNRTLQQLRQERQIDFRGGTMVFRDRGQLMKNVDYRPLLPSQSLH